MEVPLRHRSGAALPAMPSAYTRSLHPATRTPSRSCISHRPSSAHHTQRTHRPSSPASTTSHLHLRLRLHPPSPSFASFHPPPPPLPSQSTYNPLRSAATYPLRLRLPLLSVLMRLRTLIVQIHPPTRATVSTRLPKFLPKDSVNLIGRPQGDPYRHLIFADLPSAPENSSLHSTRHHLN